ncbi:hypothetical protein [Umezawaea tangerina]|uniref:Guanylate cyclase domain-containing protein n=1 Tax=Umezawaea tangerina TaxID=84725 RepID=A0A2T0TFY4_9PSEU|nr:hypothetical protein [Umezawaea tangerina]PRY44574.1 hypothetical protein CLV43_102139 [Umezawaea tangerina]
MELPPYRAVLIVDTKDFGSNSSRVQAEMADTIYDVLSRAFERAGLAQVLAEALFPHNTGDGYGLGFDPRHLPAVVTRLFDALQDELADRDKRMRATGRPGTLRMRASLNVGPVRPEPDRRAAVVGSTVITAYRLLDSAPVRDVLTQSDPTQTFVSVVLSQRVFEDVLATEYATLPATSVVPTTVQVKEFTGTVYLYVPKPSGDLLRTGIGTAADYRSDLADAKPTREQPTYGNTTNIMTGTHSGTAIQVGHVHGNIRHHDR